MTVSEMIAALGGATRLAERLGLKRSAVAMWVVRGAVPGERELAVWRLCLEAGIAWEPPGADAIRAQLGAAPAPAAAPEAA